MTNREKLAKMNNQELADWLCSQNTNCDTCKKKEICVIGLDKMVF